MVARDITQHEGWYGGEGYYKTCGMVWWRGILQKMKYSMVAIDTTRRRGGGLVNMVARDTTR